MQAAAASWRDELTAFDPEVEHLRTLARGGVIHAGECRGGAAGKPSRRPSGRMREENAMRDGLNHATRFERRDASPRSKDWVIQGWAGLEVLEARR